tara:strand:- start:199 stop:450 length:252 start_codon:yes stop_codon:yes gene_type:complete
MNEEIKARVNTIDYKLIDLDVKLNKILNLLEEDVQPNCKKMSSHIDFVDNVYDNVKNPLDYLCNKINNLTGTTESKTLENVKK